MRVSHSNTGILFFFRQQVHRLLHTIHTDLNVNCLVQTNTKRSYCASTSEFPGGQHAVRDRCMHWSHQRGTKGNSAYKWRSRTNMAHNLSATLSTLKTMAYWDTVSNGVLQARPTFQGCFLPPSWRHLQTNRRENPRYYIINIIYVYLKRTVGRTYRIA
jgi:hypothetical protein